MTENSSVNDYIQRAIRAREAGEFVLGMHLYLAAYEEASSHPEANGMALSSLREAWNIACDLKERTMAEYIFEKIEPYLTGEEIASYANKLQDLALDRLEEYGFSREELQDMAEMISQDLMEADGSLFKVESISIPHVLVGGGSHDLDVADAPVAEDAVLEVPPVAEKHGKPEQVGTCVAVPDFNPYDMNNTSSVGKSYHAATNDGSGSYVFTRDEDRALESEQARERAREGAADVVAAGAADGDFASPADVDTTPSDDSAPAVDGGGAAGHPGAAASAELATQGGRTVSQDAPSMPELGQVAPNPLNYRSLAGYHEAVSTVHELGVGLQHDAGFANFVKMMNARHGLDRMPAIDTLLFRAPVIEDATRFVDATIGEIGLPVLRMSMEEGLHGAPMLCVSTQGDNRPRMNHAHNRFNGPSILVIDDLDMWVMPQMPENMEGIAGFMMANMSRGAREAMNLIQSAIEDPDVFVLATSTMDAEVDPFFYELLEPITIIDIANPSEDERRDIWYEIMRTHPSMRTLKLDMLLRYSQGLPRYDIYMAARSAIEDAYKYGLAQRMYMPVTEQNIYDKLAACQPVDSDEYRAIEDAILESFRAELDDLEDLVNDKPE